MYSRAWPQATAFGELKQKIEDSEVKSSKLPPLQGGGPGGGAGGTGVSRIGEGVVVIAIKPNSKEHREIRSPAHGGAEARKAALAAIQAADAGTRNKTVQLQQKAAVGHRGRAESSPSRTDSPRGVSPAIDGIQTSHRGRSIFRGAISSPRGSTSPSGW